jgi:hypothetical protein
MIRIMERDNNMSKAYGIDFGITYNEKAFVSIIDSVGDYRLHDTPYVPANY